MTKRILAFVMVLAMVFSVLPVSLVSAEVSDSSLTKHTHSDAHACGKQCSGSVTWTAWNDGASLPSESGHYYLTTDVQLTATVDTAAGKDITICLNGYNIRSKASARIGYIYGKLTIADCTGYEKDGKYVCGSVVGSSAADGAVLSVRRGGTLVLEGGRITGGTTTGTAGGGGVYLQKGTSAGAGGLMYMYGGEISGNDGHNGGGVCVGGGDSGYAAAAFYMYGGIITGNNARNHGGGVYVVSRSIMEVTDGTITGNTVVNKGTAVYMDGGYSKLTVSGAVQLDGAHFANTGNVGLKVNGLTEGTQITMTTTVAEGAEPDITKTVSLASGGKQETWSAHWVTANSESVSMVDGAFVMGHYHGTTRYNAWTGTDSHNTLPNGNKCYYLVNDIVRNTGGGSITIAADTTQHMCLNGHTITHRNPSGRLYGINGNFILEDCTAYTDSEGNYISGGIAYAGETASSTNNGMFANVARGGTMTITGGQIYGFESSLDSSKNGTLIYVQGANTTAKAVLNLEGGQIHSNKAACNGSVVLTMKADPAATTLDTYSQINISGGKIFGNTSTSGGVIAAVSNYINITGGEITGNTVKNGAVYGRNENNISVSGAPTIYGNNGGNLYIADNRLLTVGELTGGKIGIGASTIDRNISNAITLEEAAFFESDNGEIELNYMDGCLYLGTLSTHLHAIDGAVSDQRWSKWTSTTSLPTETGYYYLENDVQMSSGVSVTGDVKLCLNGKTVTAAANSRILTLSTGATLTITDCCETCGVLTGGNRTYGGAINVSRGAIFNLYNGKLTGNTSQTAEGMGGAVYMQAANTSTNGGVFNMYGGIITGNSANKGGAISTGDGAETSKALAQINIYGGTISDNQSAENGGAIRTGTYGLVNIYGGTITGNHCDTRGGAIYMGKNGKLDIQGGLITANTTVTNGAAIYTLTETVVSGGEITNNLSGSDGGALYAYGTTLEISGGTFSGNKVTKGAGGAIGISSRTQAVISGGTITGNTAANGGAIIAQGGADLTIQGGTIAKNNATLSGGAIYVNVPGSTTGDVSVLTIQGGTITENTSIKNGGGMYITEAEFIMTGGTISKNQSPTYGGGVFAIRTTSKVTGGTISGNVSTKDGAGAYFNAGTAQVGGDVKVTGNNSQKGAGGGLGFTGKCQAKLTGGTISGNIAGNAGGIIVQGQAHLIMNGGSVVSNETRQSGGGIYVNKASMDFNGGTVSYNKSVKNGGGIYTNESTLRFTGTSFTANKAEGSGGGIFLSKSTAAFTGGIFKDNHAERYAGGLYLSDTESTVANIKVTGNSGVLGSGGFHCYKGKVTIKDVEVIGNNSDTSCGGIYATQLCELTVNDCLVEKNTAPRGAGVMAHARAKLTMNNVVIRYNEGVEGAGVYINSNVTKATINDCQIIGNIARKRVSTTGTMILGVGAGVYMNTTTATTTGNSILHINGTVIRDNQAEGIGGGLYVNKQMDLFLDGCTVENNVSGDMGGGIYQASGTSLFVKNTDIIGNTSAGNGSAIYAGSDFTLDGGKITGNKTSDGTAIYIAPSRYDGHSYINAVVKLGGDLVIFGNEGTMEGDLYFDEGVAAAGTTEGFGQNTKIKIQLHSGVLTNALLAAYHYEGGDQVYTITYGDRSLTDPEYLGPLVIPGVQEESQAQTSDILLYAGIAVIALAALGGLVLVVLKKKKSAAAEGK